MTAVRSLLAIAREDVVVEELLGAFERTLEVERVLWRPPVSSVLGERLLRPTYGDGVARVVRVAVRGVARVIASGLAARAWVKAADRAPQLRSSSDQVALFTSPDQVELASAITGPRFYHAIDDFTAYAWSPRRVIEAERRLVECCSRVFAVSEALAGTLRERHALSAERVVVVPNGVPEEFVGEGHGVADLIGGAPRLIEGSRGRRPHETRIAGVLGTFGGIPIDTGSDGMRRTCDAVDTGMRETRVAGVLGTISSRLRLEWLRRAADAVPWLHWRFVGGIDDAELAPGDRVHLQWLVRHPRCTFEGARPYRELVTIAREVDIAVIPYSERGVNACGSPARLFLHLAAGHPILATPGCRQIEEHVPLVTMCPDLDALIGELAKLRERGDDLRRARWEAARRHTWSERARVMLDAMRAAS